MSKKKSKEDRKTFYLDDDESKPVTAAGVIIYRFNSGVMEVLLADTRGTFEDLGGRADNDDKDIMSVAAREAHEESNELLSKTKIKNRLKKATPIYGGTKMKYVIYIIEANEDEAKLKSSDFGDKENHDNIKRKIKWFPVDKISTAEMFKEKLNWRIKNRKIFDLLSTIKKQHKVTIDLFSTEDEEIGETPKKVKKDQK